MTLPASAQSASQPENWRTPRPLTDDDQYHFELVFEIAAVILSVIVGRALFPGDDSYWTNVYMTGIGVLITVLVLDRRAERRTRLQEERELKAQLVRDASSIVNDVAVNAVHQMNKRGWLEGDDGLLAGVDLSWANLQGVNLENANLQRVRGSWTNFQGANLRHANLKGANLEVANLKGANLGGAYLQGVNLSNTSLQDASLWNANLEGANLWSANLQGVILRNTNLQEANLRNANLQEANLIVAKLQKANLRDAKLQGADLGNANLENAEFGQDSIFPAVFDETTILPDGTYWTPDTDLTKFTKPGETD